MLVFAYTFAIPSQLRLEFSKFQIRITEWLGWKAPYSPQPHSCFVLAAPQLRLLRAHPWPGAPTALGHCAKASLPPK